ncbi:MAG: N-acetylglucosamine-6-phosphate deacetylase [Bacteroidia bacterium]
MSQSVKARHYHTGQAIEVFFEGKTIARIENIASAPNLPAIFPGLVDIQVNGWNGTDINRPGVEPQDFVKITRDLRRKGITTWIPTLITQSVENLEATLRAYIKMYPQIRSAAPGIHLEGPFISPEDGARGAHPAQFVRSPDWKLMEKWIEISEGNIRLITLSPEWPEAPDFIKKCVKAGIRVSIGHTAAESSQIQAAVAAGATLSTHLGNGSHQMLRRHPNYIWDQMAADELFATVITDGFHLPDVVIKTILKVKAEKALLVSDTTAIGGLPPGEYDAPIGGKVVLTPAGKLHMEANANMLAGSASNLLDCVRYLAGTGMESLPDAWDRGSVLPAAFMGLPQAKGLTPGAPADWVLVRQEHGKFDLVEVCKDGIRYECEM